MSVTVSETLDFQQYQLQFAARIRDPDNVARPVGVLARRMRIYEQIVFQNLRSALGNCFPVSAKVLGQRQWRQLVRGFFVHHRAQAPLFRQIPEEFLIYLQACDQAGWLPLPPYLVSLAHYEWIELAVASAEAEMPVTVPECDLMGGIPILVPVLELLQYEYPVHKISPRHKPTQPLPIPVHLAVYRDTADDVQFTELSAVTVRLLQLLKPGTMRGQDALQQLAEEMRHPDLQQLMDFGREMLEMLKAQGLILGIKPEANGPP